MDAANIANELKLKAKSLGFSHVGIAKIEELKQDRAFLEEWIKQGYHGDMAWMGNHHDLREDVTKLVDGAKTIVCMLLNYFPEKKQDPEIPQIAKYAYGRDYHKIIRKRQKELLQFANSIAGANGRGFVDTAPLFERRWAMKSGLGWIGKNTCLLNKDVGSFTFIGSLILDIELPADKEEYMRCGSCTRCIDACPTGAIEQEFVLNASKCISYHTIEQKSKLSENTNLNNWAFGCDICQDVCPWNRKNVFHNEPDFTLKEERNHLSIKDWLSLSEEDFAKKYNGTPLIRSGYKKMKQNIIQITRTGSKP